MVIAHNEIVGILQVLALLHRLTVTQTVHHLHVHPTENVVNVAEENERGREEGLLLKFHHERESLEHPQLPEQKNRRIRIEAEKLNYFCGYE